MNPIDEKIAKLKELTKDVGDAEVISTFLELLGMFLRDVHHIKEDIATIARRS